MTPLHPADGVQIGTWCVTIGVALFSAYQQRRLKATEAQLAAALKERDEFRGKYEALQTHVDAVEDRLEDKIDALQRQVDALTQSSDFRIVGEAWRLITGQDYPGTPPQKI